VAKPAIAPPSNDPTQGMAPDRVYDFAAEESAQSGPQPKVWLLGWADEREKALHQLLSQGKVEATRLDEDRISAAQERDVIIASTLSLHTLMPAGRRFPKGLLIICGLAEDADIRDAKALGARMYLRPPFSAEQLSRAVKSLQSDSK
jgi:hypothetical protein